MFQCIPKWWIYTLDSVLHETVIVTSKRQIQNAFTTTLAIPKYYISLSMAGQLEADSCLLDPSGYTPALDEQHSPLRAE